MISKNKQKYIRSLELKKVRNDEGVFLAEGNKLVSELIPYFDCTLLAATSEWLLDNPHIRATEILEISRDELGRISQLKTPQQVLAVFRQRQHHFQISELGQQLSIALDGIQDPGNLGTIIRVADWFGIHTILCSPDTADVYNPKVVQSTMGALARVHVHYLDLEQLITQLPSHFPVYGTFLDGDNLYTHPLSASGLIVMGNEGNGISPTVSRHINHRLLIPSYPTGAVTGESLNVAMATGIVCAEFRRRL